MTDKINPSHYRHVSGVECKDIAGFFSFHLGSAIKHIWRAGQKPGETILDDLRKAKQHLEFEIERFEKMEEIKANLRKSRPNG